MAASAGRTAASRGGGEWQLRAVHVAQSRSNNGIAAMPLTAAASPYLPKFGLAANGGFSL